MMKQVLSARTALLTGAAALLVWLGVASSSTAQVDPTVSVDASPDSGNTGNSVGTIDTCVGVSAGSDFSIDVVIENVSGIAGFQASLLYDPAVLRVDAVDYDGAPPSSPFLLASTGSAVLDFGAATPDSDGNFLLAAAMFNPLGVVGANGDGVLARLTMHAVGSGTSALDLTGVKLSNPSGGSILPVDASNFYAGPVADAVAAVGTSCSPDSDGDTVPDATDNCPAWPNPDQSLPPWPVSPGDSDCDASTDAAEGTIGTDPADNCPDDPADDAWPPDFDMNTVINVSDVFQVLPPYFGTAVPPASLRRDLAPDGVINISDVFMVLPPFFGAACT